MNSTPMEPHPVTCANCNLLVGWSDKPVERYYCIPCFDMVPIKNPESRRPEDETNANFVVVQPASEPGEPNAEWIWFGVIDGHNVVTFGRWPKHGSQKRYKLADIQPTEHDHPPASEPAPASAPDGAQNARRNWSVLK